MTPEEILFTNYQRKFIKIYDNYYLSSNGLLFSYFNNKLRQIKPSYKLNRNFKSYPTLRISYKGKRLIWLQYRLQMTYFSNEEIAGLQVNHKDGIVEPNVEIEVLEALDQIENCAHRDFMNGLYKEIDQNFSECDDGNPAGLFAKSEKFSKCDVHNFL